MEISLCTWSSFAWEQADNGRGWKGGSRMTVHSMWAYTIGSEWPGGWCVYICTYHSLLVGDINFQLLWMPLLIIAYTGYNMPISWTAKNFAWKPLANWPKFVTVKVFVLLIYNQQKVLQLDTRSCAFLLLGDIQTLSDNQMATLQPALMVSLRRGYAGACVYVYAWT